MPKHRKYTETTDQPALTELFDLDKAQLRSPSFATCYREVERLLRALLPPADPSTDEGEPSAPTV
jgi:hypothetical protein